MVWNNRINLIIRDNEFIEEVAILILLTKNSLEPYRNFNNLLFFYYDFRESQTLYDQICKNVIKIIFNNLLKDKDLALNIKLFIEKESLDVNENECQRVDQIRKINFIKSKINLDLINNYVYGVTSFRLIDSEQEASIVYKLEGLNRYILKIKFGSREIIMNNIKLNELIVGTINTPKINRKIELVDKKNLLNVI